MRDQALLDQFRRDGYAVARGLFSTAEAEGYKAHFMALRAAGDHPLDHKGVDTADSDPLREYPRMTHMHRWDRISLEWLTHPRLNRCMTKILGREPYAVQSMLYFKPPGSRGQALHQDQFYLKVRPGTCMAAWMALDRSDEENGCLQVVPGSQDLPILCTERADTSTSFTDIAAPLPEGMARVPVVMEPGDVAFFPGGLIHGSFPNNSKERFRRALAGHYVAGEAEKVSAYYHPVLRMDGTEVEMGASEGGGPCGVWVDVDGKPEVEMRPAGAWQPHMQGLGEASPN